MSKVLVIYHGRNERNRLSRECTKYFFKAGEPFTVRLGEIDTQGITIFFKEDDLINRSPETLAGLIFESCYPQVEVKLSDRSWDILSARVIEKEGVPGWLDNFLTGLVRT